MPPLMSASPLIPTTRCSGAPSRIRYMQRGSSARRYQPRHDLAKLSPGELRLREPMTATAMLVLFALQRARHAPDLVAEFHDFVDLIAALAQEPQGGEDWGTLLRYTFYVADVAPERLRSVLRGHVSPAVEEALMTTTAERLLAQGRAEGEARARAEAEARGCSEGEALGRAAVLLKVLSMKFGALPSETEVRIRRATLAEFDLWV